MSPPPEAGVKGRSIRSIEREEGLAYARRYREGQPFKALLDAIYGESPAPARAGFPFRDHLTCAEWI